MSAVTAAWRRYRQADQHAWDEYQLAKCAAYESLTANTAAAFASCEQFARDSMDAYLAQLRRAYGDPLTAEHPYRRVDLADLPKLLRDHESAVAKSVLDREAKVTSLRLDYRAECTRASDRYEAQLREARTSWLFGTWTAGDRVVYA